MDGQAASPRRYFPMCTRPGVHIARENAYKGRTGTFRFGLCGVWQAGKVTTDRAGATVCKSCWKIAQRADA